MYAPTKILQATLGHLALASIAAPAAVIYTDLETLIPSPPVQIDVNGDALAEFEFFASNSHRRVEFVSDDIRIIGISDRIGDIVREVGYFSIGESIGSSTLSGQNSWLTFQDLEFGGVASARFLDCFPNPSGGPSICFGQFNGIQTRGFMAFELTLPDGPHYGWFETSGGIVLHGFAFETTPNTPIITGVVPEPNTPTLLALALAILLRRRRK